MKSKIILPVFILLSLIIAGIIHTRAQKCDCEKRINYNSVHILNHLDRDSLFAPLGENLKGEVLKDWQSFNLESDSFKIVSKNSRREIIAHYNEGNVHYGALYYPINYNPNQNYPLLLWAPGLNQLQPIVNLDQNIPSGIFKFFKDHFIAIPSFRGQFLESNGQKYCSDGFFGDAFDGATDDLLRFQYLITQNYPIDKDHLKISGISRGGTVALLAATRDTSYEKVVDISGPTDFTSFEIYYKFGLQYKYQFLSEEKPIRELRKKMLKSSPIHFVEHIRSPLLLNYGDSDATVDISNLENLETKLVGKKNIKILKESRGHQSGDLSVIFDWMKT